MFELIYPDDIAPEIPAPDVSTASERSGAGTALSGLVRTDAGNRSTPGMASDRVRREMFPVILPNGEVIGRASRQYCHSGANPLHPVVHLHILDRYGRLFLQKRSSRKDIQPGKWDTAVGGHVDYGESILEALFRESSEELGFRDYNPVWICSYEFTSSIEKEMVNVFAAVGNFTLVPDHDEVDEIRPWSMDEISENLGKSVFTPNFEGEFLRIKDMLSSLL